MSLNFVFSRQRETFIRGVGLAAVAAAFPHVQLFNPAASKREVCIQQIAFSAGAAGTVAIRSHDVALATLDGAGFAKTLGGAAALAELRSASPAAETGTLITVLACDSVNRVITFPSPIILRPGKGLLVNFQVVNTAFRASFEWVELEEKV